MRSLDWPPSHTTLPPSRHPALLLFHYHTYTQDCIAHLHTPDWPPSDTTLLPSRHPALLLFHSHTYSPDYIAHLHAPDWLLSDTILPISYNFWELHRHFHTYTPDFFAHMHPPARPLSVSIQPLFHNPALSHLHYKAELPVQLVRSHIPVLPIFLFVRYLAHVLKYPKEHALLYIIHHPIYKISCLSLSFLSFLSTQKSLLHQPPLPTASFPSSFCLPGQTLPKEPFRPLSVFPSIRFFDVILPHDPGDLKYLPAFVPVSLLLSPNLNFHQFPAFSTIPS